MKFSELQRDKKAVLKHLHVQDDHSVFTDKACSIYIPKKWQDTPLAKMEGEVYILALFILVIDKKYTLFNANALMNIKPSSINTAFMDGIECIEFTFQAGDVVIGNLNLAQDNNLPYYIGNIIVDKGNIVPYLTKEDFLQLYITCGQFAGLRLPNYAYVIFYLSHVLRLSKDKSKLVREGKPTDPWTFIPFNSVMYATNSTLTKMNGSYLDEGIQSALVSPSEEASNLEQILRA